MRITILCENLVGRLAGCGEHGFSVFIEMSQANYLFDTGNGHGIVPNSLALRKDLKAVKKIFLSHGHQDHSGGLPEVLKVKGKVDVHVHPDVFIDRIHVFQEQGEEKKRFVGLPFKKSYLEFLGHSFNKEFTK
jgi:7,8-dihydropterin-6-yl-methyl-4-(beta-D-ribofuranosyl)aminobenzene 5'-phosphate synthase